MSDNVNKKEIEVVTEVQAAEENDWDRNVGQDVIVQVRVQVLDKDNNKDETKGNETEHCNEEANKELLNEDSDDDYYVYKDEESRLLEEKKRLRRRKIKDWRKKKEILFGDYLI